MLSVTVHKDVAEYKPKIVGRLTLRTLLCILGGVGSAILAGIYVNFVLGIDIVANSFLIYAVSIPFWLVGFFTPKGMKFEEFLPTYLRHVLSSNRLLYIPSIIKMGYADDTNTKKKRGKTYGNEYRKFVKIRGIEAYCPKTGDVR